MKVLSIGTDRKLFEKGSAVSVRNIEYASKTEELHIIVFSLKKLGLKPYFVNNLYVYPTNSTFRFMYVFDAFRIGKKLIGHCRLLGDPPKRRGNSGNLIISSQDPFETGLVGYFLKRKFGFPLQIQIHTDFLSLHFRNSILNRIRLLIAKNIIPKADGLRVVNELIKTSIKNKFPNLRITPEILPVFVDIEKIINAEPKRNLKTDFPQFEFIVFMASRLTKEKRIDVALRAFRRVLNDFPHAGLVIAGDGIESTYLRKLVEEFDLKDHVIFVGWQDDLISYYKTADLFLLTSEYEGYGMTLIEAGASGCPVVTTNVGIAQTNVFKDGVNSFVCSVDDVDCLSKSISELIVSEEKRSLFKKEIQVSIKKVSVAKEDYVAKYINLLEDLINKGE